MQRISKKAAYLLIEENTQESVHIARCNSEEEILDAVDAWEACGRPHLLSESHITVYHRVNDSVDPVMSF